MGKKFKITEEQYNKCLAENITLNADVDAAGGDVKKAVDTTKQEAQKNGVDLNKATIQIPGKSIGEGRIITKKKLMENRLKVLKRNSTLFNVSDFIKK